MCRRISALAVLVLVMLSDLTWAERRQEKQIASLLHADRFDMGVRVHVVRRNPDAPHLIPGVPLEIVRTHDRGHMCRVYLENGKRRASWCGPSNYQTVWYVSEHAEEVIFHPGTLPKWQLVQGSEGSSKTVSIAQWLYLNGVLPYVGMDTEAGFTAPIEKRIEHVRREAARHWPAGTYRYNVAQKLYTFFAGPRVQLVSAHIRSEAEGSPLQGYSFVVVASDELQDHHALDADIISRNRDPRGTGKRLASSTFKDSTDWRNFKASAESNPDWFIRRLLGRDSPFISPEHWERMKRGMTDREYRRRVLAEDVGPERQLYYSWKRHLEIGGKVAAGNLRPRPLNATDVTRRELARYASNAGLLIGHDPGKRQHVSIFLKAYEFPGDNRRDAQNRPLPPLVRWFVVDEVTTPECTVEAHVAQVLERIRAKWKCNLLDAYTGGPSQNAPTALCRIDPHTTSGTEHPGRTVYSQWRRAGIQTMAAAYNDQQKPTPIKVEERIDLLNTLLCNVDDERRLFVLSDDGGTNPAAPELVKAFESMERDEAGNAEWERKDASDRSHWPSAVAFALWLIEKPRIDTWRSRAA